MQQDRVIAFAGIQNLRDLGGYALGSGGATRWRSVLRSGRVSPAESASLASLVEMGLLTVLDLRSPGELAYEPNPFSDCAKVTYRNVSLFEALSPIAATRDDGSAFDLSARYCDALDGCRETIAEALSVIAGADEEGMVLFHCSAGKDRTGIVAALLLSLAGVDEDTIVADYALTASVARPLLSLLREQALARGADIALVERFLSCEPETMRALLAHLNGRYHGAEAYAGRIGLGGTTVERLRRRLGAGS